MCRVVRSEEDEEKSKAGASLLPQDPSDMDDDDIISYQRKATPLMIQSMSRSPRHRLFCGSLLWLLSLDVSS